MIVCPSPKLIYNAQPPLATSRKVDAETFKQVKKGNVGQQERVGTAYDADM